MKYTQYIKSLLMVVMLFVISTVSYGGQPIWTYTPLTATTVSIGAADTVTIQYQVTNQSSRTHTINMQPIAGITQLTGVGLCANPFTLAGKSSCILSLQVDGSQIKSVINNGPIICNNNSMSTCYRPSASNVLNITPVTSSGVVINTTGSPLVLQANGSSNSLTINNTSMTETAINILSDFTGTALDGNVTEISNTCAYVLPQASCMLVYLPGSNTIAQTNFTIKGTNTNTLTVAIQINSGATLSSVNPSTGGIAGGTAVTLTGTGFTGATSVTFGGVTATSVNVISSTSLTAITPAHALGVVDVEISTPSGNATMSNAYTYVPTVIGQSAYGGVIACLNGGTNNLIAAAVDNNSGIEWGGLGVAIASTGDSDGALNIENVVDCLTFDTSGGCPGNVPINNYAAGICSSYEIDSQGNTPCQIGNTCYNDWFVPAGNNLSGQLACLYDNRVSIGNFASAVYWSSTENNLSEAWTQNFTNGSEISDVKSSISNVRCVRNFSV